MLFSEAARRKVVRCGKGGRKFKQSLNSGNAKMDRYTMTRSAPEVRNEMSEKIAKQYHYSLLLLPHYIF